MADHVTDHVTEDMSVEKEAAVELLQHVKLEMVDSKDVQTGG